MCDHDRCPDPPACAALRRLGYLVVHCMAGEIFSLIAFPNAATVRVREAPWVAVESRGERFARAEIELVARDRGGSVL